MRNTTLQRKANATRVILLNNLRTDSQLDSGIERLIESVCCREHNPDWEDKTRYTALSITPDRLVLERRLSAQIPVLRQNQASGQQEFQNNREHVQHS